MSTCLAFARTTPSTARVLGRILLVSGILLSPLLLTAHEGTQAQIAALSAQIAREPQTADLLLRRADLFRVEGQWAKGLADLDRAERLDPALAAPHLIRARLQFDRGAWRLSERSATLFLARQPDHAEGHLVRARARLRGGDRAGAIADFTAALAVTPLPDVYIERARATLDRDSAIRGLDEGIARLGPIVTLELEAIDLDLEARRYGSALARLGRLSAGVARQESWLARKGAILERAGRFDEARAAYRAALDAARAASAQRRPSRAALELVQQVTGNLARLEAGASRSSGRPAR